MTRNSDDRQGGEGGDSSRDASPGPKCSPELSVTIEGGYETVMRRLDRPRSGGRGDLDAICGALEHTLLAVEEIDGGLRSEVYEAADLDLDDPWELRKYLEVLAMHDLVRLEDDHWVPVRSPDSGLSRDRSASTSDRSRTADDR